MTPSNTRRMRHHQYGRADLPDQEREALRKAVRLEIFTLVYTGCAIGIVALVVGNSQAMKTAWISDMLSLLPQIAFLVALRFVRRSPTRDHPYGLHRAMAVGHLVAGVALLAVGASLAVESVSGLVRLEHPTIGTINLFGSAIWLGWLMIAAMVVTIVGPAFLFGPPKARVAATLHNKLLHTDADMAKADWTTGTASIVGILGVGIGLWWLDGTAAAFISLSIIADGVRNTRHAVADLMDERAHTYDDRQPHPLSRDIARYLRSRPWVREVAIRMRDQGQVFHVEAFVVPRRDRVSVAQITEAEQGVADLDWKVQDIVISITDELPEEADPAR